MLKRYLIILIGLLAMAGCNRKAGKVPEPERSVYYWRTTLHFSDAERQWLKEHQVKKLFLRFFDVVPGSDEGTKPNATLRFTDSIPSGMEVVPTVFITEDCFSEGWRTDNLPSLLVDRILQMCETHDIAQPREIQLDCDWTRSSETGYFHLLQQVGSLLHAKGMRLSATIRLHQLRMTPPPVDYGALMLYNTGDATDRRCPNPILSMEAVEPYLKHLADYELPLCAAYPVFGWKLLFGGDKFKAIAYDVDLNDTTLLRRRSADTYVAISSREIASGPAADAVEAHINPGDEILVREVPFSLLQALKKRVEEYAPHIHEQVIIYDLKTENIKRYNPDEYETIYHP
ncbi:MAG: hypothetical protein Q4B68_07605 [Bacteroidales bacterium]|nr:hypothetical protein [Bacteroidales bacterium]